MLYSTSFCFLHFMSLRCSCCILSLLAFCTLCQCPSHLVFYLIWSGALHAEAVKRVVLFCLLLFILLACLLASSVYNLLLKCWCTEAGMGRPRQALREPIAGAGGPSGYDVARSKSVTDMPTRIPVSVLPVPLDAVEPDVKKPRLFGP